LGGEHRRHRRVGGGVDDDGLERGGVGDREPGAGGVEPEGLDEESR
jgi:hypothetical protein